MKTQSHFFTVHKLQPLCERFLNGWRSLLSFSEPLSLVAQSLPKSSILRTIVHVFRAQVAGILALIKSYTANKRTLVGLGGMFVAAPVAYFAYAMFDRGHHILGYYHHNYWHLFFLIRFQVSEVVFLIGLYILFSKSPYAKAISVKLGFVLMAMTMNIAAESNEEIWDTFNIYLWGAGVCFSLALFFLLDFMVWKKFHRIDSFDARQKGLYQIADSVDAEKWKSMMMETLRQKYEFNSKF